MWELACLGVSSAAALGASLVIVFPVTTLWVSANTAISRSAEQGQQPRTPCQQATVAVGGT
ncbi:MAG TPA: hypothetical protein ENI30_10675, partial [Gammaproteobacteria bacterium]|nr:hypothetical protein [Gammaproteobacteria bacterium]